MPEMFVMPFRPAYDSNGATIPGAQAWFTLSGTNDPSPVYTTSSLTTPRTNPIVANGVGKFPRSYLDPAITAGSGYRVRIYTADAEVGVDTPIEEYDPYTGAEQGSQGPTGPGGGSEVDTRATLAAIVGQAEGASHYLTEAGREGMFVWDSSDLSDEATADPQQGIYVAADSDPTGVQGAWVRQVDGPHNVKWFGATGDGTTNDGAAVLAALAYLGSMAQSGFGYSSSTSELFFPKGHYYLGANTLDLTYTTILTGEGSGQAGGAASLLRWDAGTTGIRTQRTNTTGATATQAASGHGGDGSIIRGLYLKGGFTTTEGEYHGIHLRATATLEDLFIEYFQGDAVYIKATIGGGAGSEGAANFFQINRVFTQYCRNGLYVEGADTNAGNVVSFSAIACRQWGIWDKSFLGNTYVASHVAACGRVAFNTGGASNPASFASQGGNRYVVIRGQEAGASTNAPTGAATNNTWWIYIGAGGTDAASGVVAWTSGFTFRAGGGYLIEGVSNTTSLVNPYGEIDQYSQFDQNVSILGNGFLQGHIKVSGGVAAANRVASVGASLNGFRFKGNLEVVGNANLNSQENFIGSSTGTAADSILYLDCSNAVTDLAFNVAGVEKARIRGVNATNGMDIKGNAVIRLFIGGTQVGNIGATGYDSPGNTFVYSINGVQVVGPRSTGWTADTGTAKKTATATYAPGSNLTYSATYVQAEQTATSTRLQLIEPALRDATQEIKALKDALIAHGLLGT